MECVCKVVLFSVSCSGLMTLCRVFLLYLVPTIYRFKYYFAWTVAEAGLTVAGMNYNGLNERGIQQWDRYVNTRIRHVEFQTSLAKLPEHWNVCTGLFLRQCKHTSPRTYTTFFSSVSNMYTWYQPLLQSVQFNTHSDSPHLLHNLPPLGLALHTDV